MHHIGIMAPKTEFTKPGQKFATPPATDSLLKFYKTLHKQKKDSEMAMKWCLEHGVFTNDKAARIDVLLKLQKLALKKK